MSSISKVESPANTVPSRRAAVAVTLCGICAFLELYCTQPLLPLITRIFHVSEASAGLTVSATTLGVAISAPFFAALAERLPRKRVIVASLVALALPSILGATATSLHQLVFWRMLQGFAVPGVIAVVVTYIGEEWPPQKLPFMMSLYVSGTALGGLLGRLSAGLLTEWFSWRIGFVVIGITALCGTFVVWLWLPNGRRRPAAPPLGHGALAAFPRQSMYLLRNRSLVATLLVGFNVLFCMVGVFSWITFRLSAAPFHLSTGALSYLFLVYLVALFVTPGAGLWIGRRGMRTGIMLAISCSTTGVLLTLAPKLVIVVAGLSLVATGVLIAQTVTQSYLRHAAPPEGRVSAAGMYLTSYYLGGTAAGVVPGIFWHLGKWPACAAFILLTQTCALSVALWGWRTPSPSMTYARQ
ncbi:MAG TPA: MFS transporter [Terracidiphilus sp.]|nr:MFS transporter [Terracidiphilus sp.]